MPLLAVTGNNRKKLNQLWGLPHGQGNGSGIGWEVHSGYACGSGTEMFKLERRGYIAGNGATVAGAKGRTIIGMIAFFLAICF